MIHIRPFQLADEALLPHFLALAAHENDVEVVMSNPNLARYAVGFGRAGDLAVVAVDGQTSAVVGMAWARLWTSNNCGFGFVDEATPELAVAVEPEFQGRGIGACLVQGLKICLRRHHKAVSLNVRAESRAVALYERLVFVKIEGSERTNRTGGQSFNMKARLESALSH